MNLFASIYERETRAVRLYTQTIVWSLYRETHTVYTEICMKYNLHKVDRGSTLAKVLCYKSEGR